MVNTKSCEKILVVLNSNTNALTITSLCSMTHLNSYTVKECLKFLQPIVPQIEVIQAGKTKIIRLIGSQTEKEMNTDGKRNFGKV